MKIYKKELIDKIYNSDNIKQIINDIYYKYEYFYTISNNPRKIIISILYINSKRLEKFNNTHKYLFNDKVINISLYYELECMNINELEKIIFENIT